MTDQNVQTIEPQEVAPASEHKTLFDALSAAQSEMPEIPKERTADAGKYKYQYADISDVLRLVRPVLARHNISLTQTTRIQDQNILLVTSLYHPSTPDPLESIYPVCAVNNDHQRMGAAMTYARRTSLCALVGVAATEDLDGADAAKSGEGPTQRMSAHAAKTELNWDEIQHAIDNAPTLRHVEAMREKAKTRKDWPGSYLSVALERCDIRERVLTWRDDNAERFDGFDTAKTADEVDRISDWIKQETEALTDDLLACEVDAMAEKARNRIVEDAKR